MRPRIALVHAVREAIEPIEAALGKLWPEAEPMHLLDDRLSVDRAMETGLSPDMYRRIGELGTYTLAANTAGILFTCSALGPAIEAFARRAPVPVLKPNEAMFAEALEAGDRVGMLATFTPSVASMTEEFEMLAAALGRCDARLESRCVPEAMAALKAGNGERHDALLAEAATHLAGCDVVMLAQFSMARAQSAVSAASGRKVLTSPDSAVRKLKALVAGTRQTCNPLR